jgi:hypothetical protein
VRYRSLLRMLCWPSRFLRNLSGRLHGSTAQVFQRPTG